MGYSQSTEHYHLPQFQPHDSAKWTTDVNEAFATIDGQMWANSQGGVDWTDTINDIKNRITELESSGSTPFKITQFNTEIAPNSKVVNEAAFYKIETDNFNFYKLVGSIYMATGVLTPRAPTIASTADTELKNCDVKANNFMLSDNQKNLYRMLVLYDRTNGFGIYPETTLANPFEYNFNLTWVKNK